MAQNAERLIILNDVAFGLLNRLYHCVHYHNDDIFTGDVDKYTKDLSKKFPMFPDALNKGPRYEVFTKRAADVQQATRNYYFTFLDVLNFNDEAWKLLTEMMDTTRHWNMNPDLMSMFYKLFTNFCRVHMLVEKAETRRYFLSAYGKAHQCCLGNQEPNIEKIAQYLDEFAKPLQRIREQATKFSDTLCNELLPFAMTISTFSDAKVFANKKMFNIVDDVANMGRPTDETLFSKVMNVSDFREWVIFVFLVAPAGLQRPEARMMLTTTLKNDFVLPIWRNITFQPCAEYVQLFNTFKINKTALKKHRSCVEDAYKSYEETIAFHLQIRTFLRVTCMTLLEFFTEFSPALAPKIMMLLAVVRLGRDEVVWYFRHLHATPYNKKRVEFPEDPFVSDLIFYVHSITDLLRTHQPEISNYYLQYLREGVGDKDVTRDGNTFRTSAANQGAQLGEISTLIDIVLTGISQVSENTSMENIRLNWYRISAGCSHQNSGIQASTVETFSKQLTKVINHTRFIDVLGLQQQIKSHCSFSELHWYDKDLDAAFQTCLRSTGTARNCISFVRLLNNAMHNIHLRICPEEQKVIGLKIGATGKQWLKSIVEQIQKLIEHIAIETTGFRAQTSTDTIINSMQSGRLISPGQESHFQNVRMINKPRLWKKAVSELVGAVHNYDTLTIYNLELVPREYLLDQISTHIRQYIRKIIMGKTGDEKARGMGDMPYPMPPPKVMLNEISDLILAYQNIQFFTNINVSKIVNEVLLSEFQFGNVGGRLGENINVMNSLKLDEIRDENSPAVHYIANWYRLLFSGTYFSKSVTYSKLDRCFINLQKFDNNHAFDIAEYTDGPGLEALSTLMGPQGIRVLNAYLMMSVGKYTETVKTSLTTYKVTLDNLANKFSHRPAWKASCQSLEELDFVVNSSIQLGAVLQFRLDLAKAHGAVMSQAAPFVKNAVQLAYNHVRSKRGEVENGFSKLDLLALDTGIDANLGDSMLRRAIHKYCAHQSDFDLFNLLPELYGIAFTSKVWRSAHFRIASKGHANNAHCMALCISSLIIATAMNAPNMATRNMNLGQVIKGSMQRFVKNASYSMLHMNAEQANTTNIAHMMVFLEQFISVSGGRIEMAYLEECFPFAFIRQNMIALYESQTDIHTRTTTTVEGEEKKSEM